MRHQIADLISTLPKYHGYAKRPATIQPGDAWPLLGSLDRGRGLTFSKSWRVMVMLATDEDTATERLDRDLEALAVALTPIAYVSSARPLAIQTEAGDLYGVVLEAKTT